MATSGIEAVEPVNVAAAARLGKTVRVGEDEVARVEPELRVLVLRAAVDGQRQRMAAEPLGRAATQTRSSGWPALQ